MKDGKESKTIYVTTIDLFGVKSVNGSFTFVYTQLQTFNLQRQQKIIMSLVCILHKYSIRTYGIVFVTILVSMKLYKFIKNIEVGQCLSNAIRLYDFINYL